MLKNILTYSVLALSLFTWSQKSNKAPIYLGQAFYLGSD